MKCNVVRDLLPLYFDGLCSDDTKKQLENHFENCEECRKLKQNLESEQNWSEENQEWDKSIEPLKKVKQTIRRKNIFIAICILVLFLLCAVTGILTYGQINKKGISFELVYDAVRFHNIGEEFAEGNIAPLYELLSDSWSLQDEESGVVRMAYSDRDTYAEDMKNVISEKYQQYFSGKHLIYKGIEEIGYMEANDFRENATLFVCLKFEGDDNIEYYIRLYKNMDNRYLADDYFGEASLTYVSNENQVEEGGMQDNQQDEQIEVFHTYDSLFSCLTNCLSDDALHMSRTIVLTGGQRALQGDITLAENEWMNIAAISEDDLLNGTVELAEESEEEYKKLMEAGYFLTDITWNVKSYDRERHLYRYQVNMEFTNGENLDKGIVTIDCYRISDKFILINGTEQVYGDDLPSGTVQMMEELYK